MDSQLQELESFVRTDTDDVRLPLASSTTHTAQTNRAFVLNSSRNFSFEDRLLPELKSTRHVRVRVVATGLCGSDVSATMRSLSAGRNYLCS